MPSLCIGSELNSRPVLLLPKIHAEAPPAVPTIVFSIHNSLWWIQIQRICWRALSKAVEKNVINTAHVLCLFAPTNSYGFSVIPRDKQADAVGHSY